jgi:hypothetical protein
MKKMIVGSLGLASLLFLNGCATAVPSAQSGRVNGALYENYSGPLWVTSNTAGTKSGSASASSFLGLFATGDASIQAAAASAGITKIQHVDQKVQKVLGLWAQYTVTVYGE